MPEEMESPVEHLSEEIHEAAEHAREGWLKLSALFSAIFAVMAAITGLQAAHYANDAMVEEIEASDQWSYFQAKGIKSMIVESQGRLLGELGKTHGEQDQQAQKYHDEQAEIKAKAEEKNEAAKHHLEQHEILASAVTMFQVAIAMIAIAVLSRRKRYLGFSGLLGCIGVFLYAARLVFLSDAYFISAIVFKLASPCSN